MKRDRSLRPLFTISAISFGIFLITSAPVLHVKVSADTTSWKMPQAGRPVQQDSSPELRARRVKQIIASPVLSEFEVWVRRYVDKKLRANKSNLKRGQNLAVQRRELFKELIKLAPAEALKRAISEADYKRLPASIGIEKRVSAYGDLIVYVAMLRQRNDPRERIDREVVIDKVRYQAFVYGRREAMSTKYDIPLQGIILDGLMAVDESPMRTLKPSEYLSRAVDLAKLNQLMVVAEVGGRLEYFSNQGAIEKFGQEQAEWEAKIGPVRPQGSKLFWPWTENLKKVLFVRIDFPDRPGEPVDVSNSPLTAERAQAVMDNEVGPFYVNNSYNKTSLETTVAPVVVRMPQNQSFYVGLLAGVLISDAENAARAVGFEPDDFDLDIFAMSYNEGFPYAGKGETGGRGAVLNGAFDMDTMAHELGHNYGLMHANSWLNTDSMVVIGLGSNLEYGNPFDVMGEGPDARAHFNGHYKKRLNWLTDENIQTITSDGFYRVFAHDSPEPGGIRSLKIRKDSSKNYWIEFRQLFTDNANAMNGAMILQDSESTSFRETELLDFRPNTSERSDAPLRVGECFSDPESRIRVMVCGKGGTTPESLDIRVELNAGCTFSLGHTTESFSASGGEGTVPLDTQSGCQVFVTSNADWIYAQPTDASPAHYIVAANYDSQPRTGTITIGGQTFTVQQRAATTACAPLPAGLVAWWRGEGNAVDQTGINHGALIGNTLFRGGKIGGGFSSDNSNTAALVEVADSPSLALSRSMTFEGWVNLAGSEGAVIERRGNLHASYSLEIQHTNKLAFLITDSSGQGLAPTSDVPLPFNEFVHVAATLDYRESNSQIKLYINGALATTPVTIPPFDLDPLTNPKIKIGDLNGITDELSVYDRALEPSEIQAIYNAGIAASGAAGKCLPPSGSAGGVPLGAVQLDAATYTVNENGRAAVTVTVTRVGDTSNDATVDYGTTDGSASERSDYLAALGRLRFAARETSKTITVFVVNDALGEGPETFNLTLSNPAGCTLGSTSSATVTITSDETVDGPNPVNEATFDTEFFVRQHYLDFFNRESDVSGLAFRKNQIDECSTQACRDARKVSVSADFFHSIEFQQTGFLVERLYKTAYGSATGTSTYGGFHQLSVPVVRLREFLRDTQQIGKDVVVGQCIADAILESNKQTLIEEFVLRPRFRTAYPASMTPAAFVDSLNTKAGGVLSQAERDQLVNDLAAGNKTRAQVLRAVTEDPDLFAAEANRAFVLAQFFGYLRRNPDESPEGDYTDYDFWLSRLNESNGNFVAAEMIEAFITSGEYQRRFGPYAETRVPVIRLGNVVNSGIQSRERLVIRDREAWADVWRRIYALQSPRPPLPEIDFAKEMVIVAARGRQPGGGYTINIDAARERDNRLETWVSHTSPSARCLTTLATTAPVDIVRLKKTARMILFSNEEDEAYDCL